MGKYDIGIADKSVWVTATPAVGDVFMPFYITEIGRFYADGNYITDREGHDSYIILYTVGGSGYVSTGDFKCELKSGEAVVFDCKNSHCYRSAGDTWEFFWAHLRGNGVEGLVNAVNYSGIRSVRIKDTGAFASALARVTEEAAGKDICSMAKVSSRIHDILNVMIEDSLSPTERSDSSHAAEIRAVVGYMEENYGERINIDDIIRRIHVSKYYFIRLFKQYMGMTPYSYLISYRINRAKILLRTGRLSIGEIAVMTGFSDASNFINQFKKLTGQKPTEYRKRFSR